MRRTKWVAQGPNKLQGSTIMKLHDDPLLGRLIINSDQAVLDMAINRAGAEELLEALTEFLGKNV